jgi:hypothetical protein
LSGEICIVSIATNTYKYFSTGLTSLRKPTFHEGTNSITFFAAGSVTFFTYYIDTDTSFQSTTYSTDEGIQERSIGTDGLIYFGTFTTATVYSFDPVTQSVVSYGSANQDLGSVYAYALGGDSTHIYVSLRGPYNVGNYWMATPDLANIELIEVGTDGEVFAVAAAYSNLALFDNDGVNIVEAMPDASVKDAIKFGTDLYYFSGYANCTWKWDTSLDWDLITNPIQIPIPISSAFYHYRLLKHDDYVFVGINKERTATGVSVAWINNTTEVVDSTEGTALAAELVNYYFSDLLLINGGTKLVLVVGRNNPENFSRIYVWDLTLGVDLNAQTPFILDFNFNTITPNECLWFGVTDKFLVRDGKNLILVDLGTSTFSYRSFPTVNTYITSLKSSLHTNNKIYLMSNEESSSRYFYELDPATWDYKRISSNLTATGVGIRTTVITDGIMYLYGDKSITTHNGTREIKWVEKMNL